MRTASEDNALEQVPFQAKPSEIMIKPTHKKTKDTQRRARIWERLTEDSASNVWLWVREHSEMLF